MVGVEMNILLHMCCAPCTTYSAGRFRSLGYDIHGFFFNPNIHPYLEFVKRMQTLKNYCASESIPVIIDGDYELEQYLRAVLDSSKGRCRACYSLRLEQTAKTAASLGIPCFSTTLAISPYQDHELLQMEGEAAANRHSVEFIYEDLRPGYRESVSTSRQLGLYRQPYCGCVFSEKERYFKTPGRQSDA
jgi:epoxyqueuosine reductase